jgi:RNA polymerase sigma-70 factor (ECF subfamily)
LHEAANRKRWWFRHKSRETSIEPNEHDLEGLNLAAKDILADEGDSPFESAAHEEVRQRVEEELHKVPEPYRTALILRDLEEMSYEEIAEITQVTLGTVKSRLTRGREALKQRLIPYIRECGTELGLQSPDEFEKKPPVADRLAAGGQQFEVTS